MTRAVLGIGIGLLLSERIGGGARKAVGWALVVSGALVTIPLALEVLQKSRSSDDARTAVDARTGVKERPRTEASLTH